MKNNLIALVISIMFPFLYVSGVSAQAASDELLEEAQPGTSTETDDLLSEMDAGTESNKAAEGAPQAESAAVAKPAVPAAAAPNAAFEKIEALQLSDTDLVTFMKSGGLRSRTLK